jgi:large subunit ribosomal protein L24
MRLNMIIKKGDNVIVITGKDKGKTGKVERVLPKMGKIIISGLNLKKSHQKPKRKDEKGQIVEKSMPLDVSNVSILDSKSNKPTRIGMKINEKGKKERISKRSGVVIS